MSTTKECWSVCGEEFTFDSLGDLLDSRGDELRPGHKVWRGTALPPSLSSLVDADRVIEDIGERAYDFGGEWADNYPEVTPEHKAKLQTLLEQWLAECPSARFYQVVDAKPYVLSCDDFTPEQLEEIAHEEEDAQRAAQAVQTDTAMQDERGRHADWVDDTHAALEARDAKIAAQAAQGGEHG
ncbi:hypothetical protein [Comamonas sp.]|uniref:hypothetical protein n=1 Tax=Comamonas sp. TaxID=34028 RepID=UPI003A92A449